MINFLLEFSIIGNFIFLQIFVTIKNYNLILTPASVLLINSDTNQLG